MQIQIICFINSTIWEEQQSNSEQWDSGCYLLTCTTLQLLAFRLTFTAKKSGFTFKSQ